MRLDQAVAARFPEVSRRKARELIAARRVLVNEHPVGIASRDIPDDARIVIVDALPEVEIIELRDAWVAVNKPSGMPTQPARDRRDRSLEELLRLRFGNIWVVHRLDTGTSGVVVFARTHDSAARLSELFASGAVRKTYVALVDGSIEDELRVDAPIARASESSFAASEHGREALTTIRPLRVIGERTLVEVDIATGRTHQIRVHLASIGHPVAGDRKYGPGSKAPRLMLHAWKLEHPELGTLTAPLPPELAFQP